MQVVDASLPKKRSEGGVLEEAIEGGDAVEIHGARKGVRSNASAATRRASGESLVALCARRLERKKARARASIKGTLVNFALMRQAIAAGIWSVESQ